MLQRLLLSSCLLLSLSAWACDEHQRDKGNNKGHNKGQHESHEHGKHKADHYQQGGIELSHAYVRGLPPGQSNTAAFFILKNTSDKTLTLNSIKTDAAKSVELHESLMSDGQMQMRPVKNVTLKPNESLNFLDSGKHAMLLGLNKPLQEGDEVALKFCFGEICSKQMLKVVSVLNEKKAHAHH